MESADQDPHIRAVDTNERGATPEQPESNEEDNAEKSDDSYGTLFYLALSAIVLVVGIVIIVIMLVVVKDDSEERDPSIYSSPREVDPTPVAMPRDPQSRLNMLLESVGNNVATASYLETKIPPVATQLKGMTEDAGVDPVSRAASWVVHNDRYFAEREIVERFALMVIWYNNGGNEWIVSAGWTGDDSICSWEGVTCCSEYFPDLDPHQCIDKEDHKLVALDLHGNNLKGTIPSALALLENCSILWLSNNELTGELDPIIFSSMPSLDALYVQHNRLEGEISPNIRDNGELDTLLTHGNDFTGKWPDQFCPSCKVDGICVADPISWTLNCDKLECPIGCCQDGSGGRTHCISDGN